jgi:hypothetical protein
MKSGTFVPTYIGILTPPSSGYFDTSETSVFYYVMSHKAEIGIVATQKYLHLTEILLFNWRYFCLNILRESLFKTKLIYCQL